MMESGLVDIIEVNPTTLKPDLERTEVGLNPTEAKDKMARVVEELGQLTKSNDQSGESLKATRIDQPGPSVNLVD